MYDPADPIDRRNTFSAELVDDLIKAYDLFDRDDHIRVVILTAEPNALAFCSGVRTKLASYVQL